MLAGAVDRVVDVKNLQQRGEGERDEEERSDTGKGILWSAERGENTAD